MLNRWKDARVSAGLRRAPLSLWKVLQSAVRVDACVLCGAVGSDETRLCAGCREAFLSAPLRPQGPPPRGVERHFAAFDYEWPRAQVVTRWKRRLDPELGEALGIWLGWRLGDELRSALAAEGVRKVAVVPVPLHASRQARRGGNQARVLSAALARALRSPKSRYDTMDGPRPSGLAWALEVVECYGWLVRCRATPHQRGLARRDRLRQPRGAFVLLEDGVSERIDVTLLVDDVMTTGATLSAAAAPLIQFGHRVWTVSLLRAGR